MPKQLSFDVFLSQSEDWAQLESGMCRRGNLLERRLAVPDPLNKERRFLPLRLDDALIKGFAWFCKDDVSWKFAKTDQASTFATLRDTLLGGESNIKQSHSDAYQSDKVPL